MYRILLREARAIGALTILEETCAYPRTTTRRLVQEKEEGEDEEVYGPHVAPRRQDTHTPFQGQETCVFNVLC